jgi:hypothetical protein
MAELGDLLEYQEEALIYLINVQEGPNPPLFGQRSFNNKSANFISILASLVM